MRQQDIEILQTRSEITAMQARYDANGVEWDTHFNDAITYAEQNAGRNPRLWQLAALVVNYLESALQDRLKDTEGTTWGGKALRWLVSTKVVSIVLGLLGRK